MDVIEVWSLTVLHIMVKNGSRTLIFMKGQVCKIKDDLLIEMCNYFFSDV